MGLGITQSVDTCDSIQTPSECQFENNEPIIFKDFSLGECSTAYLSLEGKVYFTGRAVVYLPKLFQMDYENLKVKNFCACDRGVAVLTNDN